MTHIILEIDDDANAALLLQLLGALTFVRTVKAIPTTPAPFPQAQEPGDFFSLAGIWEGRDVSPDTIRRRAWPQRPR